MTIFTAPQRLKIAIGGFVSLTGLSIIACVILTLSGAADLSEVFQSTLALSAVSAIGALDIACGLLLVFRSREVVLSIASDQEKTNNHGD